MDVRGRSRGLDGGELIDDSILMFRPFWNDPRVARLEFHCLAFDFQLSVSANHVARCFIVPFRRDFVVLSRRFLSQAHGNGLAGCQIGLSRFAFGRIARVDLSYSGVVSI